MVDFDNPLDQNFLDDVGKAKREVLGDALTQPRQFIIGRLNADGSVSTVVTSDEFGRVWVRQPGADTGDAVQAINTTLQLHEVSFNRPVMVKQERGEFLIVAKAPESANYDAQLATTPQKPINREQYNLALITPSKPDSSFYAYYRGGTFQLNSVAYRITDIPSSDFSGTVPVANALSIKVEINPVTGAWYETTGSAFTLSSMTAALKNGDLDTARTAGRFLIGWIRLYNGQVAIELDDILVAEHMLDIEEEIFRGAWIGTTLQNFAHTITEAGGVITGTLQKTGGGDIEYSTSTGLRTLDCTPAQTVTLTAGTDAVPQLGHVYIDHDDDTLKAKTSTYQADWPNVEHTPIAITNLRTAATTQTDGALGNQNINNRASNDQSNNAGWISLAGNHMRSQGPKWFTGVTPTITINAGPSPDDVFFSSTSGLIRQFNPQTFPAFDMATGSDIHVVNNNAAPYVTVTNLNTQTSDSAGVTLSNKYFWFTFWGIINSAGDMSHIMLNLPNGSYTSVTNAQADVSNTKVRSIPVGSEQTGFLISETLFRLQPAGSGTWTEVESNVLLTITGGGGGGSIVDPITSFSDAVFDVYNSADPTKVMELDASGITTATTRTWTAPDKDGTVAMLSDIVTNANTHNPQGRLGLTSGNPNDESDVTSATLYYTSSIGDEISLWNGVTGGYDHVAFTEKSLSLAGYTANTLYDIWGYLSSATLALDSTSWGTSAAYNIDAMTAADPCVITYLHTSQIFAVGNDVCIQGITGNINTVTHIVTSVVAIATLVEGTSYQIQIEIDTTGLTYTTGGTVRLLDNTRATAIVITNGVPRKSGDVTRRYLGTILIGGDGGETHMTTAQQFVANYYNRVARHVESVGDDVDTFTTAMSGVYQLPGLPNDCNDGQGRISYVTPYGGCYLEMTWATGMYNSVGSNANVLALQQNTIEDFATKPSGVSAFGTGTTFTAGFSRLSDHAENDGYNYVQQLMYADGNNMTVHVGAGGKFEFGVRGSIMI